MKLNRRKLCRAVCCLLVMLAVLSAFPMSASAAEPYPSYTYNGNGQPVPTATPYETAMVLNTEALGIGALDTPTDLYVTDDGEVFVLDAGNDRVVVLSPDFQPDRVIIPKDETGEPVDFKNPAGISVYHDGTILICDRKESPMDSMAAGVEKVPA